MSQDLQQYMNLRTTTLLSVGQTTNFPTLKPTTRFGVPVDAFLPPVKSRKQRRADQKKARNAKK